MDGAGPIPPFVINGSIGFVLLAFAVVFGYRGNDFLRNLFAAGFLGLVGLAFLDIWKAFIETKTGILSLFVGISLLSGALALFMAWDRRNRPPKESADSPPAEAAELTETGAFEAAFQTPEEALRAFKHSILNANVVRILGYVGRTTWRELVTWKGGPSPDTAVRVLLRDPDGAWRVPDKTQQVAFRHGNLREAVSSFSSYADKQDLSAQTEFRYLPGEPALKFALCDNASGYLSYYTVDPERTLEGSEPLEKVTDYTGRNPVLRLDRNLQYHDQIIDDLIRWFDYAWENLTKSRLMIFDLDGTLYPHERVAKEYQSCAINLLRERGVADPVRAYDAEREKLKAEFGGESPTNAATLLAMGIATQKWIDTKNEHVSSPESYVIKDDELCDLLSRLDPYYQFAVVTDNTRYQTERILRKIGVWDRFVDNIVALDDIKKPKPNVEPYREMAERLQVDRSNCIVIGDSYARDLKPAEELGMKTHLVEQPAALHEFLRKRVSRPLLADSG